MMPERSPEVESLLRSQPVLLSGASGMLGHAIASALDRQGIATLRLTRGTPKSPDEIFWNPAQGESRGVPDTRRLEGIGAAIHLSGANVAAQRWTSAYRREMIESRVDTTSVLARTLAGLKHPPRVLVTASAVGYYGDRGDQLLDETAAPGQGFFPDLCQAWEAASQPAAQAVIRVVHLRFGVVIGRDRQGKPGGALERMVPLFRLGLGGPLGSGGQWMSWISEEDAVRATLFALQNGVTQNDTLKNALLTGGVNAVSPNPVTNAEFTRALAQAVERPALLPAPAFALRLVFGQMADEALLASTRAIPQRLLDSGFSFTHPHVSEALAAALGKR
jgi:uncharacterized protein (TIGR01777 family)